MRILIHDFAGHPFQVQLSRELAWRGHEVQHLYFADLPGPKGALHPGPDDPPSLSIAPISLSAPFAKYSLWRRLLAHRTYAAAVADRLSAFAPDLVISANTPIDAQSKLLSRCRLEKVPFVHWMQDLYCLALRKVLREKFGAWAAALGAPYDRLEARVYAESDAVVMITESFEPYFTRRRLRPRRARVIHNWAALDEFHPAQNANLWPPAAESGDAVVLMYAGTMGLKHKPSLLAHLAENLAASGLNATVVVISEGIGREFLNRCQAAHPLPNLRLMDFQPYDQLPTALLSADVLLGIIDSESGRFAVPSKVLSYLCAGKPVLLAAPSDNLAARTVRQAAAGIVVSPDSPEAFASAAIALCKDASLRRSYGEAGLRYARQTFDIRAIADQFEDLFDEVLGVPASKRFAAAAR